jgi:hypothetical protein
MTDIPSLKERRARPLGCLAPVDLAGLFPRGLLLELAAAIWGIRPEKLGRPGNPACPDRKV